METNFNLLCTKSRSALDIPHDTVLTIAGQPVEILGLARTEYRDGMFWQWWIINTQKEGVENA